MNANKISHLKWFKKGIIERDYFISHKVKILLFKK